MPVNRLVNASQAPRCRHTKVGGSRCGAPARHGRLYCCFHDSAARNQEFVLPIVEDHASLQLALNKIMQALLDKLLDQKTASILLYGLQIAFANLKQLKGEQRLDELERLLHAQHPQQEQQEEESAEEEADAKGEREPRFDIEACGDLVPQGGALVAQDASPGRSPTLSESRREGARAHELRPHWNRQSGDAVAVDRRPPTPCP